MIACERQTNDLWCVITHSAMHTDLTRWQAAGILRALGLLPCRIAEVLR
jgi:hypothetical protein